MKNKIIKGLVIAAGVITGALIGRKVVTTIRNRNSNVEDVTE